MKRIALMIRFFILTVLLSLPFVVYAAGGPAATLDCNSIGPDCKYPNVGLLTFFTQIGSDSDHSLFSCTASLLEKDNTKFVLLTAGHCSGVPALMNAIGLPLTDIGIEFDPNLTIHGVINNPDPTINSQARNVFLRGGVAISAPGFFSWLDQHGKSTIVKPNAQFDLGLVVFPINAMNKNGETLLSRYGDVQPVKVLGNDTSWTIEKLIDSLPTPNSKLTLTLVGLGSTVSQDPGKPYADSATLGMRNVGPADVLHVYANTMIIDNRSWFDNIISYHGDSGGPQFYNIDGAQVQTSVMSYTNDVWGNGSPDVKTVMNGVTRLDVPDAMALINCARNANGPDFNTQVADITACVNAIRPTQ